MAVTTGRASWSCLEIQPVVGHVSQLIRVGSFLSRSSIRGRRDSGQGFPLGSHALTIGGRSAFISLERSQKRSDGYRRANYGRAVPALLETSSGGTASTKGRHF